MKLLNQFLILAIITQCILCECPFGWKDQDSNPKSEACKMPSQYGRGAGYGWKFGDSLNLKAARQRCENDNKGLGCEQWGLVIYPKCKQGFKNSACCICVPYCPNDYTEVSLTFDIPLLPGLKIKTTGLYCKRDL